MVGRSRRHIVCTDGLDTDAGEDTTLSIGEHRTVSEPGLRRCGHNDRRAWFAQPSDRIRVEVVRGVVRHEHKIGGFRHREVAGAPRIDLDHLSGVFHLRTRVHDRRDHDVTAFGGDAVW